MNSFHEIYAAWIAGSLNVFKDLKPTFPLIRPTGKKRTRHIRRALPRLMANKASRESLYYCESTPGQSFNPDYTMHRCALAASHLMWGRRPLVFYRTPREETVYYLTLVITRDWGLRTTASNGDGCRLDSSLAKQSYFPSRSR